jgi:hypothetical protein
MKTLRFLIGLFMAITILGSDKVTVNGEITIPEGTTYLLALCSSHDGNDAPYVNGNILKTIAPVDEQGELPGISAHFQRYPLAQTVPFVMNGADTITFVYIDGVNSVAGYLASYDADGSYSDDLIVDPIHEIIVAICAGLNGQVVMTGDAVALTYLYDSLTIRVGHIVPGDSTLSCVANDGSAGSGHWYYPPPYQIPVGTEQVLVTPGHYVSTAYKQEEWFDFSKYTSPPDKYWYDQRLISRSPSGTTVTINNDAIYSLTYEGASFLGYSYYSYYQTWVPPVYETVVVYQWVYPEPVWVGEGDPGQISCMFLALSDVEPPSGHIARPLVG